MFGPEGRFSQLIYSWYVRARHPGKRYTKTENKGTIKNESRQRARRGLAKIGTQKQKNKGKIKKESRQRARGGLAKNKAGQLIQRYVICKIQTRKKEKQGEHAQKRTKVTITSHKIPSTTGG